LTSLEIKAGSILIRIINYEKAIINFNFLSYNIASILFTGMEIVFENPTYSLLVKGDTLFAGSNVSLVWYSTDNGDTWNWEKFVGYTTANISILATDSNNIFAAKKDGLFISRDNGKEWQKAKLPDSAERFSPLAVNKNYAFIALTYGELWYSSDYGSTWQENNLDACISALGWKGDTLFAGVIRVLWIKYGCQLIMEQLGIR